MCAYFLSFGKGPAPVVLNPLEIAREIVGMRLASLRAHLFTIKERSLLVDGLVARVIQSGRIGEAL
jgi:hypothetical protein